MFWILSSNFWISSWKSIKQVALPGVDWEPLGPIGPFLTLWIWYWLWWWVQWWSQWWQQWWWWWCRSVWWVFWWQQKPHFRLIYLPVINTPRAQKVKIITIMIKVNQKLGKSICFWMEELFKNSSIMPWKWVINHFEVCALSKLITDSTNFQYSFHLLENYSLFRTERFKNLFQMFLLIKQKFCPVLSECFP